MYTKQAKAHKGADVAVPLENEVNYKTWQYLNCLLNTPLKTLI